LSEIYQKEVKIEKREENGQTDGFDACVALLSLFCARPGKRQLLATFSAKDNSRLIAVQTYDTSAE
jgi:hypothetical protein